MILDTNDSHCDVVPNLHRISFWSLVPVFPLPNQQAFRLNLAVVPVAIKRLYDLNIGTTPVQEGVPHEKP